MARPVLRTDAATVATSSGEIERRSTTSRLRPSSAAVLARYLHLETIPEDPRTWGVNAANSGTLAATLGRERERAFLFRDLATLRTDIPVFDDVEQLRWAGPTAAFQTLAARMDRARS